jgi:DNA-directed RNA polymerase subunit L
MSKININISEIEKQEFKILNKTLSNNNYKFQVSQSSFLKLEFSGSDMNYCLMNTMRRVCLDDIPSYAFPKELVNITANNTIFNNDYMKLRLSNIPIHNIHKKNGDLYYLNPKYWKNVIFTDPNREKHEKEIIYEMVFNTYNDTNQVKNITTNDAKYYEDGEEININDRYSKDCPLLIIQLRPAETFKASMRSILSVGERDNIFSAVSTCYYDDHTTDDIKGLFIENKNNKFTFVIESQSNNEEYQILIKACRNIIKRIKLLKDEINRKIVSKEIDEKQDMIFIFDNEDHTIGGLVNYYFQEHPDIIFSGVSKPDSLIKSIEIKISSKSKSPIKAMMEQIEKIFDILAYIELNILKMSKSNKY